MYVPLIFFATHTCIISLKRITAKCYQQQKQLGKNRVLKYEYNNT